MSDLQTKLRGTGVALVTPFTAGGDIDFDALKNVIDSVINNGVEYVVTLGTTGETPTLSKEEKKEIISFTFDTVNNRVPVVAGIGGNNTRELIHDLETFPIDKAIAILSASPYYSKPSQEGIYQHYKALAAASPKPLLVYNVPGRTGRNVEAETTLRMAHEIENIAGVKEAANHMVQMMQILSKRPAHFSVLSGDDDLVLPQLACGIDGVISVVANCFPKQFSNMVRAGLAMDFVTARQLNNPLLQVYTLLFTENNPAGVKAFLYEQGLIDNYLRLPLVPLSEPLQKKVKDYLAQITT